ncbi:unnamed protein product, partial [Meganyctiphanes norvegica]
MLGLATAEKRPLKRQKLGPPDVYPQDPKQKEDELDDVSVKQGFTHRPQISDEYGSAQNTNITSAKIASNFNAILKKKAESNQLQDTGRKKQQINIKDNFWLVTARSKTAIEAWFKDLQGYRPLTTLAKKVPIFSKREDMFLKLCEYSVPMLRATWFIKMTSAYHESKVAESKIKKRQQPDISQEWTQTLVRLLREQLNKIAEIYLGTSNTSNSGSGSTTSGTGGQGGMSSGSSGNTTPGQQPQTSPHSQGTSGCTNTPSSPQLPQVLRLWHYCVQLAHFMYQEGLLDRQELLEWVVEMVVKWKGPEHDVVLRVVLPLPLQYLDEITQSEYLSRKLAYYSAQKLAQLCQDSGYSAPQPQSPSNHVANGMPVSTSSSLDVQGQTGTSGSVGGSGGPQPAASSTINPLSATFQELMNCHQHRPVVLAMSCFIQAVTLDCPTALVWNNAAEGKPTSWLSGSPLNPLPCTPSELPMPLRYNNNQVRGQLRQMEDHIKQRSRASENRWSLDKMAINVHGSAISRVLGALDALDRHCFDRVDSANSLDTLYTKIFKETKDSSGEDEKDKSGCNGSTNNSNNNGMSSNEEAVVRTLCEWAVSVQRSGEHRALVVARLLEKRQNDLAAVESELPDDKDSVSSTQMLAFTGCVFQNLLLKFLDTQAPVYDENSLSIRSQEFGNLVLLFSELIRQDVFSHDAYMCTLISRGDLAAGGTDVKDSSDKKENITKGADAPDSPKEDANTSMEDSSKERNGSGKPSPSRHLIYAQQFPLPQDEAYNHEINQRYVLLYGVGKARDEARHAVKKLTKEILKLFSKKFSFDIAEGFKTCLPSRKKYQFSQMLTKIFFRTMLHLDCSELTLSVGNTVLEMLSGCGSGISNYLPTHDHIAFLMDLMEVALNVHGLIDFCIQIIKEIVEIENQLSERQCLVGSYCPTLILHIVGELRKYHACLLVSRDQTEAVFESLCRAVRPVTNPSECTSPDRVVFAHLYDLYTSCSFLKSKPHELISSHYPKIRQAMYSSVTPAQGKFHWSMDFLEEYIKNPKLKLESGVVKQLSDPANRYSFVCSAIIDACSPTTSNEKLNDMAGLCAELTASCNSLSAEWLGVLQALCCSSETRFGYIDVLNQVGLRDPHSTPTIHNSLAVFTAILIARHCFTLPDFLKHVVLPSLVKAWNSGEGNPDAEPGARLTCHLLLRIFKSVDTPQPSQYSAASPQNTNAGMPHRNIRLNCDRHLLAAAHTSITLSPVLAVLKAMLTVSDVLTNQSKGHTSISDIIGTSDGGAGSNDSDMLGKGAENASLSDFARYALRQICSQEWVRERCLKIPEELCSHENLLDNLLTSRQAQRLLHQICHPDSPNTNNDADEDQHTIISNILQDLDEWTLRISWLDLHLMYEQHRGSKEELNNWLDNVAQAVIEVFHTYDDKDKLDEEKEKEKEKAKSKKPQSIMLVAPLISKLPKAVQGRVLRVAGQVLEAVNFGSYTGAEEEGNEEEEDGGQSPTNSVEEMPVPAGSRKTMSSIGERGQNQNQCNITIKSGGHWPLSSHRPFLQLVLMCLEGQDDQLSDLLESLRLQLTQSLFSPKEISEKIGSSAIVPEDGRSRQMMLEALSLRFSLVGGLFDYITLSYSSSLITEWAILLVNLIIYGVIDLTNNSELFNTVLDMLTTLIHSTLQSEQPTAEREENRRHYYNLVKKIKKEIGEHNSISLRLVRHLIPLPKVQAEVVTMEQWGIVTDSKGNRLYELEKDKKHGLQAAEKPKLSPWDLLDGHRNPAPLSWHWFGATRLERKPLKYEVAHQLLRIHAGGVSRHVRAHVQATGNLTSSRISCFSHVLKSNKEEVKAPDTPTSDQSPRGGKRGGKTQATKRQRRTQTRQVPTVTNMASPTMPMYSQQGGTSSGFNGPTQNQWGNQFGQQQPPQPQPQQQQPQPYYSQQPLPPVEGETNAHLQMDIEDQRSAGGPRFQQATLSQGRVAIRQMIGQRVTGAPTPYMNSQPNQQPSFPNMATGMSQGMARQSLIRSQMRGGIQGTGGGPGMYSSSGPGMSGGPGGMPQGMPGQGNQMYGSMGPGSGPPGGPGASTGPGQSSMPYGSYQVMSSSQMMSSGPGGPAVPSGPGGAPMNYQQSYQGAQSMMGLRQQQQGGPGGYTMAQGMNQSQMVQRSQFMGGPGGGGSMGMMGSSGGYSRPGMSGAMGGPSGPSMGPGPTGPMGSQGMTSSAQGMGPTQGMGPGGQGMGPGGQGMGPGAQGMGPTGMMRQRMMMPGGAPVSSAGGPSVGPGPGQGGSLISHLQRPMGGVGQQQQQMMQQGMPTSQPGMGYPGQPY